MSIVVKLDEDALHDALTAHVMPALNLAEHWETWMLPVVSNAVDAMIARGHVPIALAEAFEDVGQFFSRVSADIFAERSRLGLPLPEGEEDDEDF